MEGDENCNDQTVVCDARFPTTASYRGCEHSAHNQGAQDDVTRVGTSRFNINLAMEKSILDVNVAMGERKLRYPGLNISHGASSPWRGLSEYEDCHLPSVSSPFPYRR